jgi:DNA-binding CsgD family transcriptional regulator
MNCYPCEAPIQLGGYDKKILTLIADGYSAIQIGKMLNKSPRTIEAYRDNLKETFRAKNIVNLIAIAISSRYIQYPNPAL